MPYDDLRRYLGALEKNLLKWVDREVDQPSGRV